MAHHFSISCVAAMVVAMLAFGAAPAASQPTPPATAGPVRQTCAADYRAFCAGVQWGGGRVLRCMRDHRDHLSQACRDALASARAARQGR